MLERIRERFQACNLELHPGKTRIVYCKDINRTEANPDIQFTFLGYTFRPRKAVDKYDRVYVNFSPAVSRDALKAMRQTIRGWQVQLKNDKSVADLSAMLRPILRGWQQYYGHFHGSALKSVWRRMNRVSGRMADAQAQEAGGPQNARRRNAQTAGATSAPRIRPLVDGLSVVGWMMGAG